MTVQTSRPYIDRTAYDEAGEALDDARRVLGHLRSLADEKTLVTLDEIEFLCGRLDKLLLGCIEACERCGI